MNHSIKASFIFSAPGTRRLRSVAAACALAAAFSTIAVPAFAQASAPKDPLQQKLESMRQTAMTAWQHKDAETLKQTMAPDFLFVGPQGVSTRDGWLSSLGFCSLVSYSIGDVQMRTLPSKGAVLVYKLHYVGDCGGKPIPADTTVTDTYARRNGRWWIVATTFTPLMQ
jgi:hypothetical protein